MERDAGCPGAEAMPEGGIRELVRIPGGIGGVNGHDREPCSRARPIRGMIESRIRQSGRAAAD